MDRLFFLLSALNFVFLISCSEAPKIEFKKGNKKVLVEIFTQAG
ncbi:MAG: hypothetical protein ABIK78_05205 [candidate division WOR-3 bacterium]